jgi:hypothetical protein
LIYPYKGLQRMAEHPMLKVFWDLVPAVLAQNDWPDCVFWQRQLDELDGFRELPQALRLLPEIKLGQRRRRKLKKQNQSVNQPTLRRYESAILKDQSIPMRERNLHDYFNALIWARFPTAKYALHERAFRSYQERPPTLTGNLRNDLTDALTRFDEGGVVYFASSEAECEPVRQLFRSLEAGPKQTFIQAQRDRFAIFGHGLLEVWQQGGRQLTASLLVAVLRDERDRSLAAALRQLNDPNGHFGTLPLDVLLGEA